MEVITPSGAKLVLNHAPFAEARALFNALCVELKNVKLSGQKDVGDLVKELFCAGFSSPSIESWFWKCAIRSTLNGNKIEPDLFEDVKLRGDYVKVFMEVVKLNVDPFKSGLYAEFSTAIGLVENILG